MDFIKHDLWPFIKTEWPGLLGVATTVVFYSVVAYIIAHFVIKYW
jgi:hypothetical protein